MKNIVADYPPEKVAAQTGIEAHVIRQLVRDFSQANAAVAYGRVGLSTQAFGGACRWLLNAFNVANGQYRQNWWRDVYPTCHGHFSRF
ncbi:MAG: hypothetical protein R2822_21475 [Spirosomataceae bacterium]